MINVSEAFLEKVKQDNRSISGKLYLGDLELTDEDIISMDMEYSLGNDNIPAIGGAVASRIDVKLFRDKLPNVLTTQLLKPYIGLETSPGTIEYIPMGQFRINPKDTVKTDKTITLVGYDILYILEDSPYESNLTFPATWSQIKAELISKGLKFANQSLTNVTIKEKPNTIRELLSDVAELLGMNVVSNRLGEIEFRGLSYTTFEFDNHKSFKLLADDEVKLTRLTVEKEEAEITYGNDSGFTIKIKNNSITTENELMTVYNRVFPLSYIAYECEVKGYPHLDVGDIIKIVDRFGVERYVPIAYHKISYRGGLKSEIRANAPSGAISSTGSTGSRSITQSLNDLRINILEVNHILADKADINLVVANEARINDLYAVKADVSDLQATNARIATLEVGYTDVNALKANVADINTLLAGNLDATNMKAGFITATSGLIANLAITNAMIANVSADKINAGSINTNKVTIKSESGNLILADNTIQIKDGTRVRVQIGKDASGDYNMYIWDSKGNLMFDAAGLTEDGIKRAIIRNDMIANDANIDASKININSVITAINNGVTKIESSSILYNGKQLNVAFNELETGLQDYTNQAIDNIQIGGRNLILNSNIKNAHAEDEERTATFSRSSVAYLSDSTQVSANVPRFEPGKFGKAILIEEGTTNRIQNGNFATGNFTGWTNWGTRGSRTIVNNNGVNFARIEHPASDTSYSYGIQSDQTVSVEPGDVITLSFVFSGDNPNYAYLMMSSGGNYPISNGLQYIDLGNGYKKGIYTWTSDRTATVGFMFAYSGTGQYAGEFSLVQIEKKPYSTSFVDGTRAAEILTIPTAGVLNPQEGTIEFWVKKLAPNRVTGNCFFATTGTKRWDAWFDAGGKIFGLYNENSGGWLYASISGTFPLNSWQHIAITWNSSGQKLYYNGQLVGVNTSTPIDFGNTIYIGSFKSTGYESNTLIDDLRISNRARTDAEILAAYQSGQSLPVDEWTTWKADFENSLRPSKSLQRDLSMSLVEGQEYMFSLTSSGKVSARIYSEEDKSDYIYADNGTTTIKFVPENTGEYIVELYSGVDDIEAKVKLEYGNKATDWTPAPEDIQAEIETRVKTTDFQIEQGRISALISEVESIEGQVNNTNQKVSSLEQTVNGFSQTVSQLQTDVNTTKSNLSQLTQDVNSFKTTVSSTYTTKEEFNNLMIGGRNLLRNSRLVRPYSNNASSYPISYSLMTEGERQFYRIVRTNTQSYPTVMSLYNTFPITNITQDLLGQTVTFSFRARASHNVNSTLMFYFDGGSNGRKHLSYHGSTFQITTSWKTFAFTVTINFSIYNSDVFRFTPHNITIPSGEIDNFYLDLCEFKIEQGNKATDWTPAPEDVENFTIEQINTAKSEIKQTTDAISHRVTTVETNMTTLETRVNNAEQKITPTAIMQTVEQQVSQGNSIIAKKSEIQQTANDLILKFASNQQSIRYIKVAQKKNNVNNYCYWGELEVYANGENIALGKPVTANFTPTRGNPSYYTDGNRTNTIQYNNTSDNWAEVIVDLGSIRNDIDSIIEFKGDSFANGREFVQKIEVSADGNKWFTVYDSDIHGKYVTDILNGKTFYLQGASAGIVKVNKDGIRVMHSGSNQYSEMRADGFVRKWPYGEAAYLNGIDVIEYEAPVSNPLSNPPPPVTLNLPARYKGREDIEIIPFLRSYWTRVPGGSDSIVYAYVETVLFVQNYNPNASPYPQVTVRAYTILENIMRNSEVPLIEYYPLSFNVLVVGK